MKLIKVIVRGRVQGVAFRYYTRKKAKELNLRGTVKNQPDGSVLVFATGADSSIKDFIKWCHIGPTTSRVSKVEIEFLTMIEDWDDFRILR